MAGSVVALMKSRATHSRVCGRRLRGNHAFFPAGPPHFSPIPRPSPVRSGHLCFNSSRLRRYLHHEVFGFPPPQNAAKHAIKQNPQHQPVRPPISGRDKEDCSLVTAEQLKNILRRKQEDASHRVARTQRRDGMKCPGGEPERINRTPAKGGAHGDAEQEGKSPGEKGFHRLRKWG